MIVTGYTTREVAEVLGLTPRQVRSYARSGLLEVRRGPRNEYRFSFPDIILLRAARELRERSLSTRKIRSALRRLREQLPAGRHLSAVLISARGDEVVVRDRDTAWEPATEQTTFDFAVEDLAARVRPFASRAADERSRQEELDADGWYDLGFDLEAVSPAEAAKAYRQALTRDPGHAEAWVNLGRLHHEAGRVAEAERHYRRAGDAEPGSGLAAFNLGVALEDRGATAEARRAYERAVSLEPELGVAHFNLARLYESAGRAEDALRHLAAYRRLRG